MMRRILVLLPWILFLTGCWSSQELDKSALVFGVGLDKPDGKLLLNFEIIKPTGSSSQGGGGGETPGGEIKHIILEKDGESIIQTIRQSIRYAKRRLYFDHARVWVISERLAKDPFVDFLDLARRDQMFRLNSYLFITQNSPHKILSTPTLYESLPSVELVSALDQTQYIAEYTSVKMYEFFKLIEGAVHNAYLPIIKLKKIETQTITSLEGTAVIKKNKMVGVLDVRETHGLSHLLNKVKSCYITVFMDKKNHKDRVTIEVIKANTKLKPILEGRQLKGKIDITLEGTIAENFTLESTDQKWINKLEQHLIEQTKKDIRVTLNKLQKELKTDITGIGLETYRKYPKQWQEIAEDWDEVFANGDLTIDVHWEVHHPGLINKSIEYHHKPRNNPFKEIPNWFK